MKKTLFLACGLLIAGACNKKNPDKEPQTVSEKQHLTFDHFQSARVVTDISQVPFVVYPKETSIKLYVRPDEKAQYIEQSIEKTETLFGETEVSNFYKIIYQVDQNPQQSKYAYVLRSDVNKDNELLLTNEDHLDEIRYAQINGKDVDTNKSFNAIGTVELIDKIAFNEVFQKYPQYLLTNNNKPQIADNVYSFRLRDGNLKELPKKETTKSGVTTWEYAGFSRDLDRQFFKAYQSESPSYYQAFSTINNEIEEEYFSSLPTFYKPKHLLAWIQDDETGCLLVVKKYNPQTYGFIELIVVNFTNFKASSSKQNLIWQDENTLLIEIHHPNTRTTSNNYTKQYVKITLKNI